MLVRLGSTLSTAVTASLAKVVRILLRPDPQHALLPQQDITAVLGLPATKAARRASGLWLSLRRAHGAPAELIVM